MIQSSVTNSYKEELFEGIHLEANDYYMALYTDSADLNKDTIGYITSGEVANGDGYTTGGKKLENVLISIDNDTALIDADDLTWDSSSIVARGCLIYNNTLAGKNALAVFDFGENYTSVNGNFKVIIPNPTESEALLRIV